MGGDEFRIFLCHHLEPGIQSFIKKKFREMKDFSLSLFKNPAGVLVGIILNLYIHFGRIDILKIWSPLICEPVYLSI